MRKKFRFKFYNWRIHNELIASIDKNIELNEFLKARSYIISKIEYGKLYITYFSMIATIAVAAAIEGSVVKLTGFDEAFKHTHILLSVTLLFIIVAAITKEISDNKRLLSIIDLITVMKAK